MRKDRFLPPIYILGLYTSLKPQPLRGPIFLPFMAVVDLLQYHYHKHCSPQNQAEFRFWLCNLELAWVCENNLTFLGLILLFYKMGLRIVPIVVKIQEFM